MACSMMLANTSPNVSPAAFSSSVCSSSSPSVVRMPLRRNSGRVRVRASNDSVQVQQQPKENGVSQVQQRAPQQNVMRKPLSPLSTLDLWDPFMPASRTFNQMLDLMNQIMEGGPAPISTPSIQRRGSGRLPWDVMEDEQNFMMRIDMPGLSKDEVKVSIVDDGILLIKGETSEERKEGDKWAARSVGTYETRVMVPDNVELEKITAELKDGVLYVTVPKKKVEERKPVEIQVS